MIRVNDVVEIIERFAPPEYAADWDNVGLQVGKKDDVVKTVLITLDVTGQVIEEAQKKRANLIISHHPITRGEIKSVTTGDFVGSRLWQAANANINVLVAHTNLDTCLGGVNDVLAAELGLKDVEILVKREDQSYYKLVCFVPASHVKKVTDAIMEAGGGQIGDYSHCTFRTEGKGTFKAGPKSKPYIGESGKISEVEELRLETIVSHMDLQGALTGMIKAHPYEEVAYDVYRLEEPRPLFGLGRIGRLERPVNLGEGLKIWQKKLGLSNPKVCGKLSDKVERVAVCGGSGGDLIKIAKEKGAQVIITGDVKYHDAQLADYLGIAVIDAGHYYTERVIVPELARLLEQELEDRGETIKVLISEVNTNPWNDD